MTDVLRRVPWNELSRSHLEELLENSVREGRTIEYKRDLYDRNDAGTREFLSDVSSFGNSIGGHLILGVEEEDGVPVSMPGVEAAVDELLLVFDSKLQTGLDPRLVGVTMKAVPLDDDRVVLVVRIPRSWNHPHMVIFKNLSRFFARNNAGKYQMDMTELRRQILGGSAVAERLRGFRGERVQLIQTNGGPIRTPQGAKLALHAVPFTALELEGWQALPEWTSVNQFMRPLGAQGWNNRINFDGLLTYSGLGNETGSYLQLFRHGMVETVNAELLNPPNGNRHIYAEYIDVRIKEAVEDISGLLAALEMSPPVAWMLTLIGVRGYEIQVPDAFSRFDTSPIDRDQIAVPEVIDVDMTMDPEEISQRLMDPVWQAGGWHRSRTFARGKDEGR